jgi:MSHA biogenesis protein MshQ
MAYGASAATGALYCAGESGTCSLPAGVTATVYYGENSTFAARTGQSGNVSCSNGYFGDPLPGVVKKCFYAVTSASNGSVGDFIPHHFDVVATAACGAFSYAGQPFASTVTARNASGAATLNFDGAAAITPNFAQAVTLSDGGATGLGTLSGATIAATAFTAGVAQASPAFAFTAKATAPMTLLLRAANAGAGTAAISSAGYTEGSMPLRSGRLRLSNAYGSARAALQLPVVAEHWSGNAWVLNSADNCTQVPAASVALSGPRTSGGGISAASTSATAFSLVAGSGLLRLAAPTPAGSSLTLDVALNLGSSTADQSCQASHPTTTGAARPWLRAQNGSCAATADRDPAARASFGIFSPETARTVHVRELF